MPLGRWPPGAIRRGPADPAKHRAGIPEDMRALVEKLTAEKTVVTLVNLNPVESREVILQAGGYAEHHWSSVTCDGRTIPLDSAVVTVRIDPAAGARLVLGTKRYVNQPTMSHPWDRGG